MAAAGYSGTLEDDPVDVKVCAADGIWSGLKVVIRKEHRAKYAQKSEGQ
ncbi:MAG: hypothetical protein ACU0CA_13745 [Paracoccaceae bacterium]